MTFDPVLPSGVLIAIASALIVIRMVALYRVLVRSASGRYLRVVLRWCGLTLAVMLVVAAAARPGLTVGAPDAQRDEITQTAAKLNVFFVVDRSVDSRVRDYADGESRMTGIRRDIEALITEYPRARFSVISFSSAASVDWPLSEDVWSLDSVIQGLSPYIRVTSDAVFEVDPAAAAEVLRAKLASAREQFPGSENVVFYFSPGASETHSPATSFDIPDGDIAGGAVLGYGTPDGGLIPTRWADGTLLYLLDPSTGQPVVSTLGEHTLQQVADDLDLPYIHREAGDPIGLVIPAVEPSESAEDPSSLVANSSAFRRELYWLATLLAASLILFEIVLTIREYRRNRIAGGDVTQ